MEAIKVAKTLLSHLLPSTLTTRNNTLSRNATVKFNNYIDPNPDAQCMVHLPPFGMILVVLGFAGKYTHHTLSMWVISTISTVISTIHV